MLLDVPIVNYDQADPETKRKLQALMWLRQYGRFDSTTPYIRTTIKDESHDNISA